MLKELFKVVADNQGGNFMVGETKSLEEWREWAIKDREQSDWENDETIKSIFFRFVHSTPQNIIALIEEVYDIKLERALITETPTFEEMSLYEMFALTGCEGFDCCDIDWDFGVYMTCNKTFEECSDYYDKFMLLLCLNIKCKKVKREWYSPCHFVDFIEANKEAINKFLNEENREDYRPMDYKELNKDEDSGYYEVYFLSFENLINGNYCESDYEKLYKLLGGK